MIYGLTCLRTCFSYKKNNSYNLYPYKLIIEEKETGFIDDFDNEFDYFEKTLITSLDIEDKEMIKDKDFIEEQNLSVVIENKNINISAKYNNFGNLKMNDMPQNINFIGNYDFSNNQFVNYFEDEVYNLVPSFEFGVDDLFPLNEQLTITEIKFK